MNNMNLTLVVLAAGIGSRYQANWGRLKQIDYFGPHNEILLEYSIYDAIQAGFKKVIFVIRKDFEKEFKNLIKNVPTNKIEVVFAFQDLDDLPEGFTRPETRTKPRGNGQAILAALTKMQGERFAVINADDIYGRESYQVLADFLSDETTKNQGAIVGYQLPKVLSENGGVSRGLCEMENGKLVKINETKNIQRINGEIIGMEESSGEEKKLSEEYLCSMGMLAFPEGIEPFAKQYFIEFLQTNLQSEKNEFYCPYILSRWKNEENQEIKVLSTTAQWFGITYQQDKEETKKRIKNLIERGVYPEKLWEE